MPIALLVIDMQVGSFGKDAKRHDVPGLIADRAHLTAARIIEHHNAIWSFLAPGGPAKVCAWRGGRRSRGR
jgi:hypothetical protein